MTGAHSKAVFAQSVRPVGLMLASLTLLGSIGIDISRADLGQAQVAGMMTELCGQPVWHRASAGSDDVDPALDARLRLKLEGTGLSALSIELAAGDGPGTRRLRSVVSMPTTAAALLGADRMHIVVTAPCNQPVGIMPPDDGEPVFSASVLGS